MPSISILMQDSVRDINYYQLYISVFLVIYRYVYEYSRIQLNSTQRLENSAYIITPVRSKLSQIKIWILLYCDTIDCVVGTSCETCTAITDESLFDCEWCPNISRQFLQMLLFKLFSDVLMVQIVTDKNGLLVVALMM